MFFVSSVIDSGYLDVFYLISFFPAFSLRSLNYTKGYLPEVELGEPDY